MTAANMYHAVQCNRSSSNKPHIPRLVSSQIMTLTQARVNGFVWMDDTRAPNREGCRSPPEFWRGGLTPPPDFEKTCLIAHIGLFIIA